MEYRFGFAINEIDYPELTQFPEIQILKDAMIYLRTGPGKLFMPVRV